MAAPPQKRARVSTDEDSVPSKSSDNTQSLAPILQSFDHEVTTKLLLEAAKAHPSVSALIKQEHSRQIALGRTKTLKFEEFSKTAWEAINVRYDILTCISCKREVTPLVISEIESAIESICKLCPEESSYDTKMNALGALCTIGYSICSGPKEARVIRRQVQESFGGEHDKLTEAMDGIVWSLSSGEWKKMRRSAWAKQLKEVVKLAGRKDILQGLGNVLDPPEEYDEEGEEEYDEEDEEEYDEYDELDEEEEEIRDEIRDEKATRKAKFQDEMREIYSPDVSSTESE